MGWAVVSDRSQHHESGRTRPAGRGAEHDDTARGARGAAGARSSRAASMASAPARNMFGCWHGSLHLRTQTFDPSRVADRLLLSSGAHDQGEAASRVIVGDGHRRPARSAAIHGGPPARSSRRPGAKLGEVHRRHERQRDFGRRMGRLAPVRTSCRAGSSCIAITRWSPRAIAETRARTRRRSPKRLGILAPVIGKRGVRAYKRSTIYRG